jgi:two-component system chemotaxis response regulator CheY
MTKILVYDSDSRFREVLRSALTALGYETVVAADGYSVPPLAQQHQPRLVILDYKPPEVDGFEILRRLRGIPACASTPVVFASAVPRFEIEMAVMSAPAVGYVDKPLNALQLKEAVEDLIGPNKPSPAAAPARPPAPDRLPPGAASSQPSFSGEPDLDGAGNDVIDLD